MSPNQSSLHKHIIPQLLRPFECSLCFKTFQKQNHLTRHIKIHSGDRQHKCPYCGKAFLRSDNLKKHIRIHTGEKFPCQFCNRGFTDSSNLTKHIRTHTGEGRHHCKFCRKHFAGLSALQRHVQEHEEMQFVMDTALIKTERTDSSDYSSYIEQNHEHLNKKGIFQQSQRLASHLLLERNRNSSSNEPYLEKRNCFNSNLLPQMKYQEPLLPAVSASRNVKKTGNSFKSYLPNMQDDDSLLKQFQVLPRKSSPLTTEKGLIALENQRLFQEQSNLPHSATSNEDSPLWQCIICFEEFSSCFPLLTHLKRHASDSIQIPDSWDYDNTTVTEAPAVEQLNCRYCQKAFTKQSELLAHMDLTLCKNCGKIFACCMLLEKHRETCKINWMDKKASNESEDNDNNTVSEKLSKISVKNNEETELENQILDTKDFPLLTVVKQEIIFSDNENAEELDHDLSTNESLLAAVDSALSLNKALSSTPTSQASKPIKDNHIDSAQMLTDTNIHSPQQKTSSNSIQEIPTETISDAIKKSQVFHSESTASLDIQSKPEDKIISANPPKPLILFDSHQQNISQDVPDSTKDVSLNMFVYEAYKCAKASLNVNDSSQHQNLCSSSTMFEPNIQSSGLFGCQNCRKNFQSVFEFKEHTKLIQTFISKFSPENSYKLETRKKCLKVHLPNGHLERNLVEGDAQLKLPNSENAQNQPVQPPSIALNANNNSLLLTCNVCHKTFSRSAQLNRHRKIHLGIKNHKCTFCPKTFLRSDNLRKHLRIHLGIKQYACVICKKRFTDSSNLVKHKRIHNANRHGYSCNVCCRTFLNYQSLYKHIQTHEPILTDGQSAADKCFTDNDGESASLKFNQKTSNLGAKTHAKKHKLQSKILDANVYDKPIFGSQSSEMSKLKVLAKHVNSQVSKNGNFTDSGFNGCNFSSHPTEPKVKVGSSNSSEQNQISLRSTKLSHDPHYETVCSSPEEFLDYLKQYNGNQQKTKRQGSLTSSNLPEEPTLEKEEWNNDVLQLIVPLPQESAAALKSEIPAVSESSSVNTIFTSLTEQMKDNLTLDMVFGGKMAHSSFTQNQLESSNLEQQISCISEVSEINTNSDQHFNTSTTNFSSLFASCDSVKNGPVSENLDSDLAASNGCFIQNTTEDKLEMSAYYSMQTSPNNLEPITEESQLTEACKQQNKKISKYSDLHGTCENSKNSTDENSIIGNLATYLSQLKDCSLLIKSE